jgi:hypothetical protein
MFVLFHMRGCGRIARPVFPAPSFQREPDQRARLEQKTCCEIAELCPQMSCHAGLDPGIHHLRESLSKQMDCRVKPGNDDVKEWLFEIRIVG